MKPPFAGPWGWLYHPWLKEIHDPGTTRSVFRKAAQVGLTETFLNRTFYNADVRSLDTLYILPNHIPDASDFSTSRFDAALRLSPHLQMLFGDTKNVGLKRAGAVNVYIRGSRSRSALKSVPVACLIFDEVDEMSKESISLALERTSGQVNPEEWFASTPMIPNRGIDALYNEGTKEEFLFRCPRCSRLGTLTFPECLVITADDFRDPKIKNSHLICKECKGLLVHEEKPLWLPTGGWEPTHPERDVRSFWISQLYSCTVNPSKIAEQYLKAQQNPEDEQEFHNSKLGQPHVVAGARLTEPMIDSAKGSHRNNTRPSKDGVFTMGIDVGHPWIHYTVVQWQTDNSIRSNDVHVRSRAKVVKFGKVMNFAELDNEMRIWRPNYTVVDIAPERRKAEEFAERFAGMVSMCVYGSAKAGRSIFEREETYQVTVDRTSWIDQIFSRFKGKPQISLPIDTDMEFEDHLKAMVRIYERDVNGNPVGRYVNGDKADHYAHSLVYSEVALSLVGNDSSNSNISGAFN